MMELLTCSKVQHLAVWLLLHHRVLAEQMLL